MSTKVTTVTSPATEHLIKALLFCLSRADIEPQEAVQALTDAMASPTALREVADDPTIGMATCEFLRYQSFDLSLGIVSALATQYLSGQLTAPDGHWRGDLASTMLQIGGLESEVDDETGEPTGALLEWIPTSLQRVTVPAGSYWLGDPCYFVPDSEWVRSLDGYSPDQPVRRMSNGARFLAFQTGRGDGFYIDQFDNTFGVDAGMLGLVPSFAAESPDVADGLEVHFPLPTVCWESYGLMRFGPHLIDTRW